MFCCTLPKSQDNKLANLSCRVFLNCLQQVKSLLGKKITRKETEKYQKDVISTREDCLSSIHQTTPKNSHRFYANPNNNEVLNSSFRGLRDDNDEDKQDEWWARTSIHKNQILKLKKQRQHAEFLIEYYSATQSLFIYKEALRKLKEFDLIYEFNRVLRNRNAEIQDILIDVTENFFPAPSRRVRRQKFEKKEFYKREEAGILSVLEMLNMNKKEGKSRFVGFKRWKRMKQTEIPNKRYNPGRGKSEEMRRGLSIPSSKDGIHVIRSHSSDSSSSLTQDFMSVIFSEQLAKRPQPKTRSLVEKQLENSIQISKRHKIGLMSRSIKKKKSDSLQS